MFKALATLTLVLIVAMTLAGARPGRVRSGSILRSAGITTRIA
jgi:hypothetical protein